MTPDGDLAPEPLFTKPTLADPAHKFRIQSAGPIHVHPSVGLCISQSLGPGHGSRSRVENVDGKMVFSGARATSRCSPSTSRPASRRPFSMPTFVVPRMPHLRARYQRALAVAGSLSRSARREEGKVVDMAAGLTVFRMAQDGKLTFAHKYDIDVGPFTQWWSGMIPLA